MACTLPLAEEEPFTFQMCCTSFQQPQRSDELAQEHSHGGQAASKVLIEPSDGI